MIDVELMAYEQLNTIPGVKWSVGFPQSFEDIDSGMGCITQVDNSVNTTTSSGIDRISNIAAQVQTWAKTPERRNELNSLIDVEMAGIGLKRGTPNHLTEIQPDETPLYRAVLLYSGAHDNKTGRIYF